MSVHLNMILVGIMEQYIVITLSVDLTVHAELDTLGGYASLTQLKHASRTLVLMEGRAWPTPLVITAHVQKATLANFATLISGNALIVHAKTMGLVLTVILILPSRSFLGTSVIARKTTMDLVVRISLIHATGSPVSITEHVPERPTTAIPAIAWGVMKERTVKRNCSVIQIRAKMTALVKM